MHIYAGYGGGPCPSRVTVPAPLHNAWPAVAVRADEVIITPNTLKSEWFQQLPCLRQVLSNQLPLLVVNWYQGFSHRRCVVKPMLKNTLPHQWYWSVMWSYKPCIALPMVKRSNVGHFLDVPSIYKLWQFSNTSHEFHVRTSEYLQYSCSQCETTCAEDHHATFWSSINHQKQTTWQTLFSILLSL